MKSMSAVLLFGLKPACIWDISISAFSLILSNKEYFTRVTDERYCAVNIALFRVSAFMQHNEFLPLPVVWP